MRAAKLPTKCKLVADTRERHVMRHDVEFEAITHEIAQITTGDYAILTPTGGILAVIERKSLDDYGASLKDGRHDNRLKMMELRAATGAAVVYIVEGPLFPAPSDCFSGIPYHTIESSIFHLMVRDNITVMRARDTLDTAKILARFTRSMDTLVEKGYVGGNMEPAVDMPLVDTPVVDVTNSMGLLKAKHDKTDHEIAREMWACFGGITTESADDFISRWSVGDAVAGIDANVISACKHTNGRKMNKRVVKALTCIDVRTTERLLACVPGLSDATAQRLLVGTTLASLLTRGAAGIDIISIAKPGGKPRKLGPALAERICRLFAYTRRPVAT